MTDVLNLPRPAWMTEDVVLLEEQARRFIAAEFIPHLEKWHEDHFYPREVWTKAGAAGLLCASMPEEYGGGGGTFAHEAVIDREYSFAGFDTFGASLHSGIVAPYILRYGTEEQKRRWLPKLATGELVGAIAMSEPGTGSDLQGVRTTAKRSGNGYVSTARKPSSPMDSTPISIIVVAKTDPKRRRQGHLADGRRNRRRRRLPPRPQAEKARHGFRRHFGIVLRGRGACRPRACSASRKAMASISL